MGLDKYTEMFLGQLWQNARALSKTIFISHFLSFLLMADIEDLQLCPINSLPSYCVAEHLGFHEIPEISEIFNCILRHDF